MSVFLTNAEYKNSLAALRALVSNNIKVNVGSFKKRSLCFYSKLPSARVLYPSPRRTPEEFRRFLITYLRKKTVNVLMPVGIDTFTLVSKYKEELEQYTTVPVVDYHTYVQAHDKQRVMEIATKLKIPTPQTYSVTSVRDALSYSTHLSFPWIVKARKGSGTGQVKYAYSKSGLKKVLREFSEFSREKESSEDIIDYSHPILQEYLPGDIYDVLVLFVHGKMRAAVAQKRVLCYPVNGGSGALNITVDYPKLVRYSQRLMTHLRWHGVAMLEFKMDNENHPRLLEVNPKFWGTLGLAIAAGVNFPYLLYKVAVEGDVPPTLRYNVGQVHGWPFPMGVKHIYDSSSKIKSLGAYLQLCAQKDSTDIKKWDLSPLSWQFILSFISSIRKFFSAPQKSK
ncbi:MAG: ATP-grasp domain-containing protein [Candidatus Heimdallarchaeota archaeon]|nr:MAG: ATP-grasp domain-containing protein [Candidatus Heimdallarchaeota archaeon]